MVRDALEDVYEYVDSAERSISRALRLVESGDLDDLFPGIHAELSKAYHLLRRIKMEISDEIEGIEEV